MKKNEGKRHEKIKTGHQRKLSTIVPVVVNLCRHQKF